MHIFHLVHVCMKYTAMDFLAYKKDILISSILPGNIKVK